MPTSWYEQMQALKSLEGSRKYAGSVRSVWRSWAEKLEQDGMTKPQRDGQQHCFMVRLGKRYRCKHWALRAWQGSVMAKHGTCETWGHGKPEPGWPQRKPQPKAWAWLQRQALLWINYSQCKGYLVSVMKTQEEAVQKNQLWFFPFWKQLQLKVMKVFWLPIKLGSLTM